MRKVIIVVALLLWSSSAFAQQASMSLEPDTDRPGANLRVFKLDTAYPQRCAKACQEDAKCRSYTYVKPGVQGPKARCWLKTSVPPAKSSACCVSGVKIVQGGEAHPTKVPIFEARPLATGPMTLEQDTDRPGLNYRSFDLDVSEPKRCQKTCQDDPECKAWTYVKPGVQGPKARCWLKTGVPAAKPNPCCVSGVKTDQGVAAPPAKIPVFEGRPLATGALTLEQDTDRPGANLRVFDLDSADSQLCAKACGDEPKCRAYTYVRPGVQGSKARCWLKSGVPPAKSNACCISGVKSAIPPIKVFDKTTTTPMKSVAWETYTDLPGSNFKSFWIKKEKEDFVAVKQCEDACKKDPQCKAFTYVNAGLQGNDARCYLKNAVPARVNNQCCTSGVVRPVTKADYCINYALNAQRSSKNNVNYQCGFTGPMWVDDYALHYEWCTQVPETASKNKASERDRLLGECTKPSASGDLAAHDVCYDLSVYGGNVVEGNVTFYPVVKNVGGTDWRSKKKGEYEITSSVYPPMDIPIIVQTMELPAYPHWELGKNQTARLTGSSLPYQPSYQYEYGWTLRHDEDSNPKNNRFYPSFDTFTSFLTGSRLAFHPWLRANKACTKEAPKYLPLNLYWDQKDLNNFPMNPSWGWQLEHSFGSPDYYPDVPWLTPLTQIRHFKFLGGEVKKLGEERDFSKATNQKLFKEYGGNYIPAGIEVPVPGVCGPHVNWTIPVTYEGYLKGAGYDADDGDFNFYLYTPDGKGAVKKNGHVGGIKVEFDSNETVDYFHTPWWSNIDKDGNATNDKYAIVTALWGMDCAHECDSELHPAWAMAIRVKDNDPDDDMWAIFVRNWGNEGFCSDNVFTVDYPKQGNHYIYRFLLPWRPGATGVTVTKKEFLQKGGVMMGEKIENNNKRVIVVFKLPHPDKRPRINGELHLKWTYPKGVSTKPYPTLKTALVNAQAAASTVDLEDTKMNKRILQQLSPDKRTLYESILRSANLKEQGIRPDSDRPLDLDIQELDHLANMPIVEMPQIQVSPDIEKLKKKRATLQRLQVSPDLHMQMQPIIENIDLAPLSETPTRIPVHSGH